MSESMPDMPVVCWPIDTSACEGWDEHPAPVRARAEALAVQALRMLTGFRIGGCSITVRPCAQGPRMGTYMDAPVGTSAFQATIVGGSWVNLVCGSPRGCGCADGRRAHLPGNVYAVDEVLLDGAVLDPAAYRIDRGTLLRVDGGSWPLYQDMALSLDEEGTFAVTYRDTIPVDGLGAYVAGVLACEFANAIVTGECRLPAGVTSITRQGISIELATGVFPGGLTGISEVDQYIRYWNPYALTGPSMVYSPDVRF